MKNLSRNGIYLVEFNSNHQIDMIDGPHSTATEVANTLKLLKLLGQRNQNSTYKMIEVKTVPLSTTLEIDDEVIRICRRLFT